MLGHLNPARQRELFRGLVELQDQGVDVQQSRELVANHAGISVAEVREIERRGLQHDWPPLDGPPG